MMRKKKARVTKSKLPPTPDPARLAKAEEEVRQGLLEWEQERAKQPSPGEGQEWEEISYEQVDEVFDRLIRKGWLSSFGTQKPDLPPSVFSGEASPEQKEWWQKVKADLEARGANPDTIEEIILGLDPDQCINVAAIYEELRSTRTLYQPQSRKKAHSIIKRYKNLLKKVNDDPCLSDELKSEFQRETNKVFHALSLLPGTSRFPIRPQKERGIPFRLDRNPERQSFWTPVIVTLVKYLLPFIQTQREVFRLTARILHVAFPAFPDRYQLVEQRYYRSSKRRTPPI